MSYFARMHNHSQYGHNSGQFPTHGRRKCPPLNIRTPNFCGIKWNWKKPVYQPPKRSNSVVEDNPKTMVLFSKEENKKLSEIGWEGISLREFKSSVIRIRDIAVYIFFYQHYRVFKALHKFLFLGHNSFPLLPRRLTRKEQFLEHFTFTNIIHTLPKTFMNVRHQLTFIGKCFQRFTLKYGIITIY